MVVANSRSIPTDNHFLSPDSNHHCRDVDWARGLHCRDREPKCLKAREGQYLRLPHIGAFKVRSVCPDVRCNTFQMAECQARVSRSSPAPHSSLPSTSPPSSLPSPTGLSLGKEEQTMHGLHSTLLPPSAVHHSLFLPHFTPSTIYPLPKPHAALEALEVKVVGNLIVAGGQDLRVFEIREEAAPVADAGAEDEPAVAGMDEMGDSFFDSAPADVSSRECKNTVLFSLYSCSPSISVRRFATRQPAGSTFSRATNCMAPSPVWQACVLLTVVSTVSTGCLSLSRMPRWVLCRSSRTNPTDGNSRVVARRHFDRIAAHV